MSMERDQAQLLRFGTPICCFRRLCDAYMLRKFMPVEQVSEKGVVFAMAFDLSLDDRIAIKTIKEALRKFGTSDDSNVATTKRKRALTNTCMGANQTVSRIGASYSGSENPSKWQKIQDLTGSAQGPGSYGTPLSHEELQQLVDKAEQQLEKAGEPALKDDISDEESGLGNSGPSIALSSHNDGIDSTDEESSANEMDSPGEGSSSDKGSSSKESSAKPEEDSDNVDCLHIPSPECASPRPPIAELTPRSKRQRIEYTYCNGIPIHEPGKSPPKPVPPKQIQTKPRPRYAACEKIIALATIFAHCPRCGEGDFNLCSECVEEGVMCRDSGHELVNVRIDSYGDVSRWPPKKPFYW